MINQVPINSLAKERRQVAVEAHQIFLVAQEDPEVLEAQEDLENPEGLRRSPVPQKCLALQQSDSENFING